MPRPRRSRRPSPALGPRRGGCQHSSPHLRVDLFLWGSQLLLSLALCAAGTSSCMTSQCSAILPLATRKISTATIGFGPHPKAAVNGDIVALRHNETRLRPEVSRKVSQERLDRSAAVRNLRVVLLIVFAEQAVENGGISIDENALDPRQNQCLVGIHVSSFCVRRGGVPASAQHLL